MGIYSNEAAQLLKESQIEFNPNAAGLLEFAVETQRAEHAMFETMLEMDMLEYHCESGVIVVTEEEKSSAFGKALESIWNKIVEAVEKMWETVTKFLSRLFEFAMEKTKADKIIIKKYSKDFNIEKAIANDPNKEVELINIENAKKAIQSVVGKCATDYTDIIVAASGRVGRDLNEEADAIKKITDNLLGAKFEEKFKLSQLKDKAADIKSKFEAGEGYKKLAEEIVGTEAKNTLDALKKLRNELRKAKNKKLAEMIKPSVSHNTGEKEANKEARSDASDARSELALCYKYVSVMNACCSKALNFGSRVALQAMADTRKAYVAIATAAAKKEEKKAEEAPAPKPEGEEAKPEGTKIEEAAYEDILEFAIMNATDEMFDISFGF